MQVDLTTVLSVFSAFMSAAVAVVVAIARVAFNNREREIDRRLDDCARTSQGIDTRLHAEEKATIRQDGEMALSRQNHSSLAEDIHEIKRLMVTKAEWQSLERHLQQMGDRRPPYPGGGSGGYSRTDPTSPPASPAPKKPFDRGDR